MTYAIGIAGTGRLAQALARLLAISGAPVRAVAGRTPERVEAATRYAGDGVQPASFSGLATLASHIVIAVADSAIEQVASEIASAPAAPAVVVHTCGAKNADCLASLKSRGAACGVLHPLQTVPAPDAGLTSLRGSFWGISGEPAAREWAAGIVGLIGGQVIEVPEGANALYHSAGVMASNLVVATLGAAQRVFCQATGATAEVALRALSPLTMAAVSNALARGPQAALTGPVERGDSGTVAAHLEALSTAPPAARELYRAASLQALELAAAKGLAPQAAAILKEILRRTDAE